MSTKYLFYYYIEIECLNELLANKYVPYSNQQWTVHNYKQTHINYLIWRPCQTRVLRWAPKQCGIPVKGMKTWLWLAKTLFWTYPRQNGFNDVDVSKHEIWNAKSKPRKMEKKRKIFNKENLRTAPHCEHRIVTAVLSYYPLPVRKTIRQLHYPHAACVEKEYA